MKRRMFFLLPDAETARAIVSELNQMGIDQTHMHVIARNDIDTTGLPASTPLQKKDGIYKIEQFVWNGNLIVFSLSLFFTLYLLLNNSPLAALVPTAIMIVSFVSGCVFTSKVPSSHLSEFETAITHGEILLVVNTPKNHVHQLENFVHHEHPEAITAGIGWTLEVFQL